MPCAIETKRSFFSTLKEVSESTAENFSGLGLLLYETGIFSKKHYEDLRPSFPPPRNVRLGDESAVRTLLEVSNNLNPLHDGFIFFNEKGDLTHVSQYFFPQPARDIVLNEAYGTRYRAAQYGSLIRGVILTGVINHDCRYFVFSKGKGVGLISELDYC